MFGITGDLAKVMTFRSLYRLEQRGLLRLPDRRASPSTTGRSTSSSSAPVSRSRDRRAARPRGVRPLRGAALLRAGRLRRRGNVQACERGDQGRRAARLLPRDPTLPLRRGRQGSCRGRPDEDRTRRGREALRPRPGVRTRARRRAPPVHRRVAALPDRPLPRQDGPRGDPLPAVREHDARAGLEPELRRSASRSRWRRTSASRTAATSTIQSVRCATSWSTTSCK